MCYAKPGPRCSSHTKAALDAAIASGDEHAIREAREAWLETPDGIAYTRDVMGLASHADYMEHAYEHRKTDYFSYREHVQEAKSEHTSWVADHPPAPVDASQLYSTVADLPVPEGARSTARRAASTDAKRAVRNFDQLAEHGIPIVRGEANRISWSTMGDHRTDYDHARFEAVKNPEPEVEAVLRGHQNTKPTTGFWSAGAAARPDGVNVPTNASGVPETWWINSHTDGGDMWDATEEENEQMRLSAVRAMQNDTVAVVPRTDAAVIRCETPEHYMNVVRRYYEPSTNGLDYKKMFKDGIDGFSVSTSCVHQHRSSTNSHPFVRRAMKGLETWDGDSTLWLDKKSFDVVTPAKDHSVPHAPPQTSSWGHDSSINWDDLFDSAEKEAAAPEQMSEQGALEDLRRRLVG